LDEVLDAGVNRVVVDRAITRAEDPASVAADFAQRLRAT
jgi:thiamine monophosphate synthase